MNATCIDISCEETLVLYLTAVVACQCLISWLLLCCCFKTWDSNKEWLFR